MPNVAVMVCVTFCNNALHTYNNNYVKRGAKSHEKIQIGTLLPKKFFKPLNAPPNSHEKYAHIIFILLFNYTENIRK